MFMRKHIPPVSRMTKNNDRQIKRLKEITEIQDKAYKKLKVEIDELTTVWAQEEEKTAQMSKLITALFSEVTD